MLALQVQATNPQLRVLQPLGYVWGKVEVEKLLRRLGSVLAILLIFLKHLAEWQGRPLT